MTEWAVFVFSLNHKREKGEGRKDYKQKREGELRGGKASWNFKNRDRAVSLSEEDTVNSVLLNSLPELPEGQS